MNYVLENARHLSKDLLHRAARDGAKESAVAPPGRSQIRMRTQTRTHLSDNLFPSSRRPCPNDSFPLLRGDAQLSKRIDAAVQTEEAIQDAGQQEDTASGELLFIEFCINGDSLAEHESMFGLEAGHLAAASQLSQTGDLSARRRIGGCVVEPQNFTHRVGAAFGQGKMI